MTLQNLLSNLSPINTKEKVDTLIQEMKKCGMKMTKNTEVAIRCAIQKVSIQKYIIATYSKLFVEKDEINQSSQPKVVFPTKIKPRKEKTKKKKKTFAITPKKEKYIPSIMRVFGSHGNKESKPYKEGTVAPHKKEYSTSYRDSISAISIPMGGANKRK